MNEYIPYEQSKELVSLGFNYYAFEWYDSETEDFSDVIKDIPAILYQQAFRFFREKCKLQSCVKPELPFSYNNPKYTIVCIETTSNFITYKECDEVWVRYNIERKRFNTYEEAELELLKVLINIAKYNPQWATY
jgi:hypothetical protein